VEQLPALAGRRLHVREPSAILKSLMSTERAASSKAPGPGVIQMQTGDPDFPTPAYIAEALNDAVERGYTHYGSFQGDPELRGVIADQLSQRSGSSWSAGDVLVTTGGSGAAYSAMFAYLNPGDQVLIPDPNFSQYADVATMIGAEPTYVQQTEDFHLDLDRLKAAAGPRAKMVILCNPCNPTGVVLHRSEIEALVEWCIERDLWILADEAYDYLIYDGRQHVSVLDLPGIEDRLLFCQTFSKTFAMTGWRLGYLAGKNGVAANGLAVHRTTANVANAAVQRAGLVALTTPSDAPAKMLEEYAYRRQMLDGILSGAEGLSWRKPEGTFYAFVKYAADLPSREMAGFLLDRGVAVRSGTEFGPAGEGYVRLSFATSRENIQEGARRLAAAAAEAGALRPTTAV
jgi:aspartate/methionine/tyrosine aminotransferase